MIVVLAAFAGSFAGGLVGYAALDRLRGRGSAPFPPAPNPVLPVPTFTANTFSPPITWPVVEDPAVPEDQVLILNSSHMVVGPDDPRASLEQIEREAKARARLAREANRDRPVGL